MVPQFCSISEIGVWTCALAYHRFWEACSRTQTVFLNWLRDPNLVERLRRMKFPSVTISCLHTGHFLRAKMIHSISEENTTFAWQ